MQKIIGKKVKNKDRDPRLSSTLFGFNFSEGTGLYHVVVTLYIKNAFFNAHSAAKIGSYFLDENNILTVDQAYDFDEKTARPIFYVNSESVMSRFKEYKNYLEDGSIKDFPYDDVIGIKLTGKNSPEALCVMVKFENGSYTRLTEFPGEAPVLNLSKATELAFDPA